MQGEIEKYLKTGKKNLVLIHIIYLISVAVWYIIPYIALVGGVFSYLNLENKSKYLSSHYAFAFRTFVIAVIGYIVVYVTSFIFIGVLMHLLLFILVVVRSIIALKFLLDDKAHPNPLTFGIK